MGLFEKFFGAKRESADSPKPTPEPQAAEINLPPRPKFSPKLPESSIAASFALEPLPIGAQSTVTAHGEVSKGSAPGVVLDRRGFTKWNVTNNTAEPVSILSPRWFPGTKEEPVIIPPGGSVANVSALSEVLIGSMRFHLPGLGFSREKSLELRTPVDTTVPGLKRKSAELNSLFQEFLGPPSKENGPSVIEALRTNEFGRAEQRMVQILTKLDYDVIRDDSIFMIFSYARTVLDLNQLTSLTAKKGDVITAPTLVTPDEDDTPPVLRTLCRRASREATVALAVLCAKELRRELGEPLSTVVRNHPQAGSITPETDAILFLHSLGVPLSPLFFRLAPGRDEAFKMIRELGKRSSGSGFAAAS